MREVAHSMTLASPREAPRHVASAPPAQPIETAVVAMDPDLIAQSAGSNTPADTTACAPDPVLPIAQVGRSAPPPIPSESDDRRADDETAIVGMDPELVARSARPGAPADTNVREADPQLPIARSGRSAPPPIPSEAGAPTAEVETAVVGMNPDLIARSADHHHPARSAKPSAEQAPPAEQRRNARAPLPSLFGQDGADATQRSHLDRCEPPRAAETCIEALLIEAPPARTYLRSIRRSVSSALAVILGALRTWAGLAATFRDAAGRRTERRPTRTAERPAASAKQRSLREPARASRRAGTASGRRGHGTSTDAA